MTVVACSLRVDDITAQADEGTILTARVERHRRDGVSGPDPGGLGRVLPRIFMGRIVGETGRCGGHAGDQYQWSEVLGFHRLTSRLGVVVLNRFVIVFREIRAVFVANHVWKAMSPGCNAREGS